VLSRKDPLHDQLNVIVRSGLVGGIILAGPSPEEVEVLNKTVGDFTAMIISSSSDQPQISYVDVDNTGGMLMAVSHLIELGHRQIAYLTPSEMDSHAYQRFQAYRQAMEMNGLKDEISIFTLYPGREEELIASVIAKQSTAVIAFDDLRALQLSTYFMREGISVPYDIALVGFDDEDFATHMAPPLTTLAQPFTEMGKAAAENLIARIEKPELPPTHLVLPLTLIVRASTGDGSKRE
jgi:LacI family transcriptional regulator